MVIPESQIRALIRLLSDEDARIVETIRDKLIDIGPVAVPLLQEAEIEQPEMADRIATILEEIRWGKLEDEMRVLAAGQDETMSLEEGAFLIARYVARNRVARVVARNPKFAAIDAAIGRDARRIVFLLRLSPVFPFNLLNYALGLTTVRFVDYLVASLGMLPGTVLYVYYGKVAGDVVAVASGSAPARGAGHYAVLALGLAATLLVTILITRNARRALQESVT